MGIFQQIFDSFKKLDLMHNAIMMNFRSILTALGLIRGTLSISKDGTTVISCGMQATHIVIPESVTWIGNDAFEGCDNLTIH